jgi:hypothetical protein
MNVHATTGIRELTAQELDQVTGGLIYNPSTGQLVFDIVSISVAVGGILGALVNWLFD